MAVDGEMVRHPARAAPTDFEAFYRANIDRVYRALAVTLRQDELAREAADEAMARAYAKWATVGHFDNPAGWDVNLRFHALTYGLPIVMANRVGREDQLTFWGGSRILDARGRSVAAAADARETLVSARLDYRNVRRARHALPTVRDANTPLVHRELARLLDGARAAP